MSEQIFDGAEINGQKFPFIRVTVASEPKIIGKFLPSLRSVFLAKFSPEKEDMRLWIKVRGIAFVKGWKWKYLRIIPKELRCSRIDLKQAGGIEADFFAYVREIRKERDALLHYVIPSKTEIESAKQGA